MEMDKRQIDLNLAPNFEKQLNVEKVQLPINSDTSFDIYYDICEWENKKYLYIKMLENTANAPFYYNKSYSIEDLYNLHKIFKADDIDEVKEDIKTLFEKGKITLHFDKNEDIVIMILDVINFATNYKINFELYREMIPQQEKDSKLIDLYTLNKKKLKPLKEIFIFIEKYKGNKAEMDLIEELRKKINALEIPGIEIVKEKEKEKVKVKEKEKGMNILNINIEKEKPISNNNKIDDLNDSEIPENLERKQSMAKKCKICPTLRNKYLFKIEKGNFMINLTLQNLYDLKWPLNECELKCDEEKSTLKPLKYEYPIFEIGKGQDGDFIIVFNKDDIKPGKYFCKLSLYVKGVKLEDDADIELNIKAK